MSYCRWSDLDFGCDLYCYEDTSGGYTTHVAGRRRTGEIPPDPLEDFVSYAITAEEFAEKYKVYMDAVDASPLEPLGLPHAGEVFNDPTLETFRARLLALRELGYVFPDEVLTRIEEEIREQKVGP